MTTTATRDELQTPHDGKHAGERAGLWTRYRAAYEKLPPGVQLIGLQLWLPVFFVIAFCFCYVLAFHAPSPKDVPVAIVGSSSETSQLASSFAAQTKGEFAVSTVGTLAQARADVRSGDLAAAYLPGATTSTLVIASSAQYQLSTVAKTVFTTVATAQKSTLTVDDISPLPASDSFGTTLFYLTLVFMIGGYMTSMFVGMMGGALRHRTRIAIIAGAAVLLPLLVTFLTHTVIGAVTGNFVELWAVGALTIFAVGMTTNGLAYFFGRFIAGAALVLFVFLGVPSSGGAIPIEFVPKFFQDVHPYIAASGTIELLKRVEYGVGPSIWVGIRLLLGYLVAGLLLTFFGKMWFTHRMRRAAVLGKRPTMMATAQFASMNAGRKAAQEAAGSAQNGGVDASPRDGGVRVDTDVVRVIADHAGVLHHGHRQDDAAPASAGPAAGAGAAAPTE